MRVKILGLVLGGLLMALPSFAQDPSRFVSVIDDLPLMKALTEVGDGIQFSTAQGRIAEATAQGRVSQSAVLAFYDSTLPQLGWSKVGVGHFVREGETLELVFERKDNGLRVRFALAPTVIQN